MNDISGDMITVDASDFFSRNVDVYGASEAFYYDLHFLNFIREHAHSPCIVDIGGGGGVFTGLCRKEFPESRLFIVDPSPLLLYKNVPEGVIPIQGSLPDDITLGEKADFVHLKEVLHHVTGPSIRGTKEMMGKSLAKIHDLLKEDGYLLLNEVYYENPIFPSFTRSLIFYGLKLQNFLGVRIPQKYFLVGLQVLFLTRKEIREMFGRYGFEVVDERYIEWDHNKYQKLLLIRNWGNMYFILKKTGENK